MSKIQLLPIIIILFASAAFAAINVDQQPSESDLQGLVPEGYRVEKVLRYKTEKENSLRYILVLSDNNNELPEKPIKMLLIDGQDKWSVLDSVEVVLENPEYPPLQPNFLENLSIETVGNQKLVFLYTMFSGGGSGSLHYYQFYTVLAGKWQLLKTIEHDRMSSLYFCLYDHKIYDAKLVKIRGEKRGKAFVYTCYLEATEYTYDGKSIIPIRTERFREKQGNRFLDETYWLVSLRNAIVRKEVFSGQSK